MRILIVEDEHKIANSLKKGLELEHFVVDVVFDGTSGLDLATSESYDLIILDRLLPQIDGIEICKKIREQENHTPVLMLTARGQIEDKVEGLNSGADDYLSKPFSFEELLARIKALIRRPSKVSNTLLKVDDLTIDTQNYIVTRSGKKIKLSAKEFSLLEYLMRNANKVLKKQQIIDHVWNYDSDILPNTLEVFIGYLRNKIDRPFKNKLIHTIRGFGYSVGEKNV